MHFTGQEVNRILDLHSLPEHSKPRLDARVAQGDEEAFLHNGYRLGWNDER